MYHRYVLKGMVRYGWALFYGVLPCLQLFGVTGETPQPGTRGFAQPTVAARDEFGGGAGRPGRARGAWLRVAGSAIRLLKDS